MNRNKSISLAIAISLALFVVYFIQSAGPTGNTVVNIDMPEVERPETIPLVIATGLIEAGSRITEDQLEIVDFPQDFAPAHMAQSTTDVVSKIAREDIFPQEFVSLTRIEDPAERPVSISHLVKPGHRLTSIQVGYISAAGGFIQQGDIVDVIAHIPLPGNDFRVKTILSSVPVLAVGDRLVRSLRQSSGSTISNRRGTIKLTFSVPYELAAKLRHIDRGTSYSISLKNPRDSEVTEMGEGILYSEVVKEYLPVEQQASVRKLEKEYFVTVFERFRSRNEPVTVELDAEILEDGPQ